MRDFDPLPSLKDTLPMPFSLRSRWSLLAILATAIACSRFLLIGSPDHSSIASAAKSSPPQALPDSISEAQVKADVQMRSPKEEIDSIQIPAGYHLELVASEPDIIAPVLCAWHRNARM